MSKQNLLHRFASYLGLSEGRPELETLDETSLRRWLTERLSHHAKVPADEIDTARSFEDYGLDSRTALQVAGELEKLIERRLSPALLYEQQNIDTLAAWLVQHTGSVQADAEEVAS